MENFLCVDVETTCWDTVSPIGQVAEIIQIGIVLVRSGVLIDQWQFEVKPELSTISKFCTDLTGISDERNYNANVRVRSYIDTCGIINRLVPQVNELPWVSWSDFDRFMFQVHAAFELEKIEDALVRLDHCVPRYVSEEQSNGLHKFAPSLYPFSQHHIDLQALCKVAYGTGKSDEILKKFSITRCEPKHNALSDAITLARLAVTIFDWLNT